MIALPIIQWEYRGELHAAKLNEYTETEYDYLYPLDSLNELFLLLGDTKGDGSCHFNYAYVIKIKNDEINLEFPAFGGRPYLNFCNGAFIFDEQEKELRYLLPQDYFHENLDETMYWFDHYKEFTKDSISGQKIIDAISRDYYKTKSFQLKFDGSVFI